MAIMAIISLQCSSLQLSTCSVDSSSQLHSGVYFGLKIDGRSADTSLAEICQEMSDFY